MAPINIDWKKVFCDEEPRREEQTPRRRRRLASPEQQEDMPAPRRDTLAEQAAGEDRVQAPGATGRPPVRASSSKAVAEQPRQGSKEASPEEIFEALRDIRDLARADLLRAYSLFIRDDRRFRALMVLPKDMRKEWLLMEIDWEQMQN